MEAHAINVVIQMEKTELTVNLPRDIVQKIREDAKREEVSQSAIVRKVLRQTYPRPSEGEPDA